MCECCQDYDWDMCDVSWSHCGLMICEVCGKDITTGEYISRYNHNGEIINQHRSCCTGKELIFCQKYDEEQAKKVAITNQMKADYEAFIDKYGQEGEDYLTYLYS